MHYHDSREIGRGQTAAACRVRFNHLAVAPRAKMKPWNQTCHRNDRLALKWQHASNLSATYEGACCTTSSAGSVSEGTAQSSPITGTCSLGTCQYCALVFPGCHDGMHRSCASCLRLPCFQRPEPRVSASTRISNDFESSLRNQSNGRAC